MARWPSFWRNDQGRIIADQLPAGMREKFGATTLFTFKAHPKLKPNLATMGGRETKMRATLRRKRKYQPRPLGLDIFRPFTATHTKQIGKR